MGETQEAAILNVLWWWLLDTKLLVYNYLLIYYWVYCYGNGSGSVILNQNCYHNWWLQDRDQKIVEVTIHTINIVIYNMYSAHTFILDYIVIVKTGRLLL